MISLIVSLCTLCCSIVTLYCVIKLTRELEELRKRK
nr:hypothetical protein MZNIZDYX_MZNIZDYX_CDS_0021 [uncultured phage]CAI9752131.1 hypothetical protein GCSOEBMH_GCSOEBMH_CDS_0021 [uncultured phage]